MRSGNGPEAFLLHEQASVVFPFGRREREAAAISGSLLNGVPPHMILPRIESALEKDPGSPNLFLAKALAETRQGEFAKAEASLEKLKRFAPDWKQTEDLENFIEKAKKEWQIRSQPHP